MPLRALPPQGSASANFATWAVILQHRALARRLAGRQQYVALPGLSSPERVRLVPHPESPGKTNAEAAECAEQAEQERDHRFKKNALLRDLQGLRTLRVLPRIG